MSDLEVRLSILVKAMRFPLIVLVVFAHSLGFTLPDVCGGTPGWNAFHFVSEMISHNFARIAVCWFYVFSGYYFFRYLKDGQFSVKWLGKKWRKRVTSLLVPYFIWNLGLAALTVLITKLKIVVGLGDDGGVADLANSGPLYWLWTGPLDFPLYFMRDLMVMSLIAPFLYLMFRWLKLRGSVIIVLAIYLLYTFTDLLPAVPGFGFRSVVFFSLGAVLGIYKLNMLELCRKIKWPSYAIAAVLLLACTLFNATAYHKMLLQLFYPFGMAAFMNICDRLIEKPTRCERMCRLESMVFFIFASHEVFILGWTKGAFLRMFGDGLMGSWISYFGVPVIVLLVCMGLYWILNKIMPQTLAFVCGGRTVKS